VEPQPDAPGWYLIPGGLSPTQLEYISEGSLTRGSGDHAIAFDVLEVAVDDERVRVRVSETAPREALSLHVRNTGPRQVLAGLGQGLQASRENPLLRQFGKQRLTPIERDPGLAGAHGWPALRPAQQDAVAACCSSGLQLVWGPPGTGKTLVIATAISHLAASGQRVLLASNNNIAVDTALYEALRILPPGRPGQAVRAGNIVLPALAANDQVRLDLLVESRQREQQVRVDHLARQLEQLRRAGTRLEEAQGRLINFNPDAYQRAIARVANKSRYDKVAEALGPAEDRLRQAQAERHLCEQQLLSLACCEAVEREANIRNDIAVVDAALASHQEASLATRLRQLGAKSKLNATRTDLLDELARAAMARRQALTASRQAGADPAPPIRPDARETADAVDHARAWLAETTAERKRLREEADLLVGAGLAVVADESLVTTEHERWILHESLPDLRRHAAEAEQQLGGLQRKYEEASEHLRKEKRAIEQGIVTDARLVATTLTQLALRPSLTRVPFDHVIVDEAAAAQLPHLAHAIGYAKTGAVLVGDYLQNGPIVDQSFPGGEEARSLFKTDCFSFFAVTDPKQAQRTEGCVVLTEQFRFGPALTQLANLVAYDGILTTAGHGSADIVVVTVDGLPEDLRTIHRESKQAGWWLIGALLARALAEHHNDAGARNAFGIVVPYVSQEEATQAALDDSAVARATPVGTSHKFQGRQFDTVLADLVEDGHGRMFNANLRGGDYAAESVRLFNVAATRARSRLYILVSRRALERAGNGPLAAVRSMVSSGRARRVDADSLLGMFGIESPAPGTPEADLVAALAPYVRVTGIHDEDAAIDEVTARIDEARKSVWCWSAWVGRHAEGIIDALDRANQRGVSVHVMARPQGEVQETNRESLRRLIARLPRVVFMQRMHQKIVVVDRQWSIVGSMNMLSHGQTSAKRIRDVMFTMDGTHFADRLLEEELANELAQQRRCPVCNEALAECGLVGSGTDRGWAWICGHDRSHRLRFPGVGSHA
jgi:phosphoglycolate phosphatase-like HAD superfamily hydrolase